MIKCPYCASEFPDEALSCPQCRSRLMESGPAAARSAKLSTWGYLTHPWSALGYLFFATLLILAGFHKLPQLQVSAPGHSTPAPSTSKAGPELNESGALPEESSPEAEVESDNPRERFRREQEERLNPNGPSPVEPKIFTNVVGYETEVRLTLARSDQLVEKFNQLAQKGKAGSDPKALNEVLNEFRVLLQEMRSLKPPAGFERCQTSLANSVALVRRGLRNKMLFIETGETAQLSKSQEDLESARQQREQGLSLIQTIKQDATAGKKETPPPSPAPQPPSPPPPKPVVIPQSPPPPPPPPTEVAPEPEPEPQPEAPPSEQPQEESPAQPESPPPDQDQGPAPE